MPGLMSDFFDLQKRTTDTFNFATKENRIHARQQQEQITPQQKDDMQSILESLYEQWQCLKYLSSTHVNKQKIFELIKFCYLSFCEAYVNKPKNVAFYHAGMHNMRQIFSPDLEEVYQQRFPSVNSPVMNGSR